MARKRRKRQGTDLSHRAEVLYAASAERMIAAELLLRERDWVFAMYAAGLAVESLLQAFSLRTGSEHDARHDLEAWLDKCPQRIVRGIRERAAAQWSEVRLSWSNELRYVSHASLAGRLKRAGRHVGVKGGPDSICKVAARSCVESARQIHTLGYAIWPET